MSLARLNAPVELATNVFQLPAWGARVSVVAGPDGLLLIDTGIRGSARKIEAGLARLGFALADVRQILLTHTHPDHAGAVARLASLTGAQVLVHGEEAPVVTGAIRAPTPFRRSLLGGVLGNLMRRLYDGSTTVYDALEHGAVLQWPEPLVVLHTPGHTPGSLSLYLPEKRLLLAGDALQYRFKRLSAPARAVTWDAARAEASIERMASLDVDAIAFSHFPALERGAKAALERLAQQNAGVTGKRFP